MDEGKKCVLKAILLLQKLEDEIDEVGFKQEMSTGPVYPRINKLREKIVNQAKGYGVVPEDQNAIDLLNQAQDLFEFELREGSENE